MGYPWVTSEDITATKLNNSQKIGKILDLEYYYWRNTKSIDDGETIWNNNSWSNVAGTASIDTTNKLVGSSSAKITTNTQYGGIHVVKSLDLSKFNDGSSSATTDYISFKVFVTAANLANIQQYLFLNFYCDAFATSTNYYEYYFDKSTITADVWNHIKVPKSSFTTHGSPSWASITGYTFKLTKTAETSASLDCIRMIRKDPSSAEPNPFQKEIDGTWTRDMQIDGGQAYIGLEYGKIICKNLDTASLSLIDTSGDTYIDFIMTLKLRIQSTTSTHRARWYVNGNQFVQAYWDSGSLFGINEYNSGSNISSTSTSEIFAAGDIVDIIMEKMGISVNARFYKNGVYVGMVSRTLTILDNLDEGYLTIGGSSSSNHYILDAAITSGKRSHTSTESFKGFNNKLQTNITAAASIDVYVPQEYEQFEIVITGAEGTEGSPTWRNISLTFNGDTGANYNIAYLDSAHAQSNGQTSMAVGNIYTGGALYSTSLKIVVVNRASAIKVVHAFNCSQGGNARMTTGSWDNETAKIYKVNIALTGDAFDAAGTITVRGID